MSAAASGANLSGADSDFEVLAKACEDPTVVYAFDRAGDNPSYPEWVASALDTYAFHYESLVSADVPGAAAAHRAALVFGMTSPDMKYLSYARRLELPDDVLTMVADQHLIEHVSPYAGSVGKSDERWNESEVRRDARGRFAAEGGTAYAVVGGRKVAVGVSNRPPEAPAAAAAVEDRQLDDDAMLQHAARQREKQERLKLRRRRAKGYEAGVASENRKKAAERERTIARVASVAAAQEPSKAATKKTEGRKALARITRTESKHEREKALSQLAGQAAQVRSRDRSRRANQPEPDNKLVSMGWFVDEDVSAYAEMHERPDFGSHRGFGIGDPTRPGKGDYWLWRPEKPFSSSDTADSELAYPLLDRRQSVVVRSAPRVVAGRPRPIVVDFTEKIRLEAQSRMRRSGRDDVWEPPTVMEQLLFDPDSKVRGTTYIYFQTPTEEYWAPLGKVFSSMSFDNSTADPRYIIQPGRHSYFRIKSDKSRTWHEVGGSESDAGWGISMPLSGRGMFKRVAVKKSDETWDESEVRRDAKGRFAQEASRKTGYRVVGGKKVAVSVAVSDAVEQKVQEAEEVRDLNDEAMLKQAEIARQKAEKSKRRKESKARRSRRSESYRSAQKAQADKAAAEKAAAKARIASVAAAQESAAAAASEKASASQAEKKPLNRIAAENKVRARNRKRLERRSRSVRGLDLRRLSSQNVGGDSEEDLRAIIDDGFDPLGRGEYDDINPATMHFKRWEDMQRYHYASLADKSWRRLPISDDRAEAVVPAVVKSELGTMTIVDFRPFITQVTNALKSEYRSSDGDMGRLKLIVEAYRDRLKEFIDNSGPYLTMESGVLVTGEGQKPHYTTIKDLIDGLQVIKYKQGAALYPMFGPDTFYLDNTWKRREAENQQYMPIMVGERVAKSDGQWDESEVKRDAAGRFAEEDGESAYRVVGGRKIAVGAGVPAQDTAEARRSAAAERMRRRGRRAAAVAHAARTEAAKREAARADSVRRMSALAAIPQQESSSSERKAVNRPLERAASSEQKSVRGRSLSAAERESAVVRSRSLAGIEYRESDDEKAAKLGAAVEPEKKKISVRSTAAEAAVGGGDEAPAAPAGDGWLKSMGTSVVEPDEDPHPVTATLQHYRDRFIAQNAEDGYKIVVGPGAFKIPASWTDQSMIHRDRESVSVSQLFFDDRALEEIVSAIEAGAENAKAVEISMLGEGTLRDPFVVDGFDFAEDTGQDVVLRKSDRRKHRLVRLHSRQEDGHDDDR